MRGQEEYRNQSSHHNKLEDDGDNNSWPLADHKLGNNSFPVHPSVKFNLKYMKREFSGALLSALQCSMLLFVF